VKLGFTGTTTCTLVADAAAATALGTVYALNKCSNAVNLKLTFTGSSSATDAEKTECEKTENDFDEAVASDQLTDYTAKATAAGAKCAVKTVTLKPSGDCDKAAADASAFHVVYEKQITAAAGADLYKGVLGAASFALAAAYL